MEISLTSFLDFVSKSGSSKMTCAKKIKLQLEEGYDPVVDFYKRFREGVQELHKSGQDKSELQKIIGILPTSKIGSYQAMVAGYKKFLGNKKISWFNPPRKVWTHGDLDICINPEIGLRWDDKLYIIKLYLKSDKLTKDKLAGTLALMKQTLNPKNATLCVLDVRNSKLFRFKENMMDLIPLIEGEAESLEFILGKINLQKRA